MSTDRASLLGIVWPDVVDLFDRALEGLRRRSPLAVGACVILAHDPFDGIVDDGEDLLTWEARAFAESEDVIDECPAGDPVEALRLLVATMDEVTGPAATAGPSTTAPTPGAPDLGDRASIGDLLANLAALTRHLPAEDGYLAVAATWETADAGQGEARRPGWVWEAETGIRTSPSHPCGVILAQGRSLAEVLIDATRRTTAWLRAHPAQA